MIIIITVVVIIIIIIETSPLICRENQWAGFYSGSSRKRTPLVLKKCPLYRDLFQDSLTRKQGNPFPLMLSVLQKCPLYKDSTVYDKRLRHERGKLIGIFTRQLI